MDKSLNKEQAPMVIGAEPKIQASPSVKRTEPSTSEPSSGRETKREKIQRKFVGIDESQQPQFENVFLQVTERLKQLGLSPVVSAKRPYESEYVGDILTVYLPPITDVKKLSPLETVIIFLIDKLRDEVRIGPASTADFDLQELSQTSKEFLTGICYGFMKFEHASLTAINSQLRVTESSMHAIWLLSAIDLVNNKDKRGHLRPSTVTGIRISGRSAGEYINSHILGVKASLGNDRAYVAETLHRIIKKIALLMSPNMKDVVEQVKVPWSDVYNVGVPHVMKPIGTGKKKSLRREAKLPLNPKKNAYLGQQEKTAFSHLMAPIWDRLSKIQESWAKLPSPKTHELFDTAVKQIQDAIKNMENHSSTIGRRLGHRKAVVDGFVKHHKQQFKKKDLPAPEVARIFFNSDELKTMTNRAKLIFSPVYSLSIDYPGMSKFLLQWNSADTVETFVTNIQAIEEFKGKTPLTDLKNMFVFWCDKFKPEHVKLGETPVAIDLANFNPFAPLEEEKPPQESDEMKT